MHYFWFYDGYWNEICNMKKTNSGCSTGLSVKKIMTLKLLIFIQVLFFSCIEKRDYFIDTEKLASKDYKTKNVVVVIMDGLRYTEGWGESTHRNIPFLSGSLAKEGIVNTAFYNSGDTYTSAGHVHITTGFYQSLNNNGEELPENPSFLQIWKSKSHDLKYSAWIIASKDKLAVLADCNHKSWSGRFLPDANCGIDGLGIGSGYRDDSLTCLKAIEIMKEFRPNLVFVNFGEPDYTAHTGNWENYLKAIKQCDSNVYKIWNFIKNHDFYKNTTAFFVTSDHGRHSDGVADGFTSHGDGCEGCRHLMFYASGPDFKENSNTSIARGQIDITVTIGKLLGFDIKNSKGEVMNELFLRARN
jgi:hypothetical protein